MRMVVAGKPRFRLHEVPPKQRTKRMRSELYTAEDGTEKIRKVPVPLSPDERQFDVFLPNNQSLRLREDQLEANGFTQRAELQDVETGEEMGFANAYIPRMDSTDEGLEALDA